MQNLTKTNAKVKLVSWGHSVASPETSTSRSSSITFGDLCLVVGTWWLGSVKAKALFGDRFDSAWLRQVLGGEGAPEALLLRVRPFHLRMGNVARVVLDVRRLRLSLLELSRLRKEGELVHSNSGRRPNQDGPQVRAQRHSDMTCPQLSLLALPLPVAGSQNLPGVKNESAVCPRHAGRQLRRAGPRLLEVAAWS